ncbi:hypothetical protein PR048_006155 [Dryococelus australis]|uniref:PiggyBac transposable element-derived protein domain-containing protein n=1 Tax=Dryococelus australis TaxID=614101 RepID=A0ABQ9IB56_9NEOP|nr:hypothetical protein PR048_006155 [Dryococelus australis]
MVSSSWSSSGEVENEQAMKKWSAGSPTASSLPGPMLVGVNTSKISVLKQYMLLNPVKRGIKLWLRCDSVNGYTNDFNVYCGKETIAYIQMAH